MSKQALILIDVQQGFASPKWGVRNNPSLEENIARLLAAWRARAWPVFHVRHDSTQATSPLAPGQAGNDFMECAAPRDGETVIAKTVNSAFIGTDLEARLRRAGLDQIILAGLTSDHCVSTTARMAANLGFQTTVVADATAAHPREDEDGQPIPADLVHRIALASLRNEFATIVKTAIFTLGALIMTACQTTPEEFAVSTQTVEPGSRITWVGKETALVGPGKIKVGAKLPEALLVNAKMETAPVGSPGQVLLINTIPSVDTPVCDRQTHILGETKVLDPRVGRVTISLDLPYAQQRFAEEAKLTGVTFFSDYRTRQFTEASGLQIERNGLLARAVIVVDAGGIVRHLQVVPEITQLPDMEAAFAVANGLVSR